jgi:WD40 repeat protein
MIMLATLLAIAVLAEPQGKTVATLPSPSHCLRVLEPLCGKVHDVDVSSDGARVLVGCDNGHVLVYELATGALVKDLFANAGPVSDVEFDALGERLLAVQVGSTHVWNAKTFELEHALSGQKLGMLYAHFSPDAQRLATGSAGNGLKLDDPTEARVWDASTGEQVALLENMGYRALPSFRGDSKALLVSAQSSFDAIVLHLDEKHTTTKLTGHSGDIGWSAWSPDGKTVLTCSMDFSGQLWDADTGNELHVLRGHTGYPLSCEFSPNGKEASTTSRVDRTTRVWNVKTGKERLVLSGHTDRPTAAHFAPDGRAFASADASGHVLVFELERGKVVAQLDGHKDIISSLDFSPDSKRIVTGGFDGCVRIWANPLMK